MKRTRDARPSYDVGQRVMCLVDRMPGMKGKCGAVSDARSGHPPYYGVRFDGDTSVHKWLSEDELAAEPKSASDAAVRRARDGRPRVKAIDFKAGKPTRYQAFDVHAFDVSDASARVVTRENFLEVPAHIARTGIQEYTALELGLEGTNRTIRLFRPAAEVFKPESYSTFDRQTITSNHPEGDVTADNYRSVTVGDAHDPAPNADGVNLDAVLLFKAADAIEMIVEYGKNQLSCGYSFVLDMTPGTTPDGQAYDGVMRDIVGNHVALVWEARGGPGLRVADRKHKTRGTTMKTVTVDSISIPFEDDTHGQLVERALKAAADSVTAATAARDAAVTESTASKAALTAATEASAKATADHATALAAVQAQVVTGDKLEALIEERGKVVTDAKAIVGSDFDGKGKSVQAIRVEALERIVGAKDESPAKALVTAIFAGKKASEVSPEIAKIAFDGVIGVLAAGGGQRSAALDAAARALAPSASDGGGSGAARAIKYGGSVPGGAPAQKTA